MSNCPIAQLFIELQYYISYIQLRVLSLLRVCVCVCVGSWAGETRIIDR